MPSMFNFGSSCRLMNNFDPQPHSNPYADDHDELTRLFPAVRQYQQLALKHKINDIFQDNGGKYLQLQIILGLKTNGKREGNDATDADGNEYEIKTVNLDLQKQFSTHHHLNPVIIAKYRQVSWYFAVYRGIELQVIYLMTPAAMEKHYQKWETTLSDGRKHINNPKVPLTDVMRDGQLVWLPPGVNQFRLPPRGTRAIYEPEIEFEV
jgi:hypothetical protein